MDSSDIENDNYGASRQGSLRLCDSSCLRQTVHYLRNVFKLIRDAFTETKLSSTEARRRLAE